MIIVLLLLALLHTVMGYGVLNLLRFEGTPVMKLTLALITGVFIAALLPFLMELVHLPLTRVNIFVVLGLCAVLLQLRQIRRFRSWSFRSPFCYDLKIYEWPFILLAGFMIFLTVWRCYYQPPLSRDFLSGAETIAEFALREHTMINSVFSVNLESTNNPFKSPFLTTLQIIYKMAGFPLGALWLSLLSVSFICFLYAVLRQLVHPVIAGILVILLLAIPELYAYSYLVLYDYSNMIYFFLGYFFLGDYLRSGKKNTFYLSVLLLSAAVYIRSETFILVLMLLPLLAAKGYKAGWKIGRVLTDVLLISLCSFLAYAVVVIVYNNHYLPVHYNVSHLMNAHPFQLGPLWKRISEIWTGLIVGEVATHFYAYIFYIFSIIAVAGLIYTRQWDRVTLFWLYGIITVFAGLCLIGFMFPLMDVMNSTKRGLFKLFPVMIMFLASSPLLQALSELIYTWEYNTPAVPEAATGKMNQAKKK